MAALGFALPGAVTAHADVLSVGVSATPTGQEMAPGFLGASFEYRALHQYTGRDPRAVDPVLLGLLGGLAPGQSPVIRIGGDSTDGTWWPIRGQIAQGGIYYPLTKGWLRTTQALAAALNAKLILGINLAAGRPAIAAAEGRAFMEGIGRKYIDALEIGNEPDLYTAFPWYKDRRGHIYRARGRGYGLSAYTNQFIQWARALPNVPLAGPAVSGPGWLGRLGSFIGAAPRLALITYHRYPLRACITDPTSPGFPTIGNLLADSASAGLATPISPFIAVAHRHNLPFRVAEMNSASCQGAKGVSDTFASALWALDTMFGFAAVGVDGVNFHMLPGSNYELFTVSHDSTGTWQAFVHPEYYGLLMFAQAFPPGARLLQSTGAGTSSHPSPVKVWATQGGDGAVRVTLINKDPNAEHDVSLSVSGATTAGSLETLQAPSVSATSGVTLGGQTFGDETTTGTLPNPSTTPVAPVAGTYAVPLPAGSAALLTIGGGGGGGIGLKRR
ncbi:MAG: glycosyl hydrolase family 79 C-terminal domain-containing protein [Solirubrobacteraceae bacterium]